MGDIVKCVLSRLCFGFKPYVKARDSVALRESLRWRIERSCHKREFNKDVKPRSLFDRFRFSRGAIFSCAFVLLLFLRSPFVSFLFEICFLESDDNWSVWLMCEFCLAPRPRTSTPISSVHQKALSKSSPGSGDRRLTGLNMICALRKWAMTWEVEWESINVECDVRAERFEAEMEESGFVRQ